MNTAKFNGLLNKLKSELSEMKFIRKCGNLYVFHSKEFDSFNDKEGISIVFDSYNRGVDIKKFTLMEYVNDEKGSMFLKSDVLAESYYIMTQIQYNKIIDFLQDYTRGT